MKWKNMRRRKMNGIKNDSNEFDLDEKEPQNLKESSFDPFYGF
jgi:hypothetical protein